MQKTTRLLALDALTGRMLDSTLSISQPGLVVTPLSVAWSHEDPSHRPSGRLSSLVIARRCYCCLSWSVAPALPEFGWFMTRVMW